MEICSFDFTENDNARPISLHFTNWKLWRIYGGEFHEHCMEIPQKEYHEMNF